METVVIGRKKSRVGLVIMLILAAIAVAASLIFFATSEAGSHLAETFGLDARPVSTEIVHSHDYSPRIFGEKN